MQEAFRLKHPTLRYEAQRSFNQALPPSYLAFYLIESARPHIRYSLTEY